MLRITPLFDVSILLKRISLEKLGARVAGRLARSPPTKANRAQSPAGSPEFRKWESCRTMPLVGGPSRRSPTSPAHHSGAAPYSLQSPSSALKTSLLRAAQISSLTLEKPETCKRELHVPYTTFTNTPHIKSPCNFFLYRLDDGGEVETEQRWNEIVVETGVPREILLVNSSKIPTETLQLASCARQTEPSTLHTKGGRGGVVVRLLDSHQDEPCSISGGVALGFLYVGIVPDDAAGRRVFSGISRYTRPCIKRRSILTSLCHSSALKTWMLIVAYNSPPHTSHKIGWWLWKTPINAGIKGRGKREIPEKTRRPTASPGTIPNMRKSGVTQPGIEPGSPWLIILLRTRRSKVVLIFRRRGVEGRSRASCPEERRKFIFDPGRRCRNVVTGKAQRARLNLPSPCPDARRATTVFWFLCTRSSRTARTCSNLSLHGATVAERLACSPPTKAIRVQSPGRVTPDFRMWESCQTMPFVDGFPRGSPVSPALSFQRCSILTSTTLIGS
ncbi:hypothetical protein PR048_021275 [Dryococelus australis]|uniref:Uncharacterized protein n=1 Tax=Dryococelus australis TaxID=614101 RepID=A0ABQ9GXS8_9NEOP|nr:hypothetical protein PR048_021275 [Dryococelus australis]